MTICHVTSRSSALASGGQHRAVGQKVIPMSFENIERCLENPQCLLGIQSSSAAGLEPRDHGLLSRHYTFPFGNVAYRSSEDTFVRLHSCEYIASRACSSVVFFNSSLFALS